MERRGSESLTQDDVLCEHLKQGEKLLAEGNRLLAAKPGPDSHIRVEIDRAAFAALSAELPHLQCDYGRNLTIAYAGDVVRIYPSE